MAESRRVLITGGAGFIGSHLAEALSADGWEVVVFDNLKTGRRDFLEHAKAQLVVGDCLDAGALERATKGADLFVHCAADPDVRVGEADANRHFEQNVVATHHAVEAARKAGARTFLFLSTSTVYGDVAVFPTPESFGPLRPISTYGASKLAGEALVSAHAHTFGFEAIVYRFANVLGPRLTHGVIHDFALKLRRDPHRLEILGDGTQTKSYCYIEDVVSAVRTTLASPHRARPVEVLNVGTDSATSVTRIAELVSEAMELQGVEFAYTGGVEGGRGWKGDVKRMLLDCSRLKALGWKAKYGSDDAVKLTAKWIAKSG